ncbi:MAG: copper-containing nitrite reductase [Caldilineaceae bacterium]
MLMNAVNNKNSLSIILVIGALWLLLIIGKSLDPPALLDWERNTSDPGKLAPAVAITTSTTSSLTAQVATTATQATAASAQAVAQAATGDAEKGKEIFGGTCVACHGPEGKGVKGLGKDMTVSTFIAGLSDSDLLAFIKKGRPPGDPLNTTGVLMPPKGGNPAMTDEQLQNVIAFIRTINKPTGSAPAAGAAAQVSSTASVSTTQVVTSAQPATMTMAMTTSASVTSTTAQAMTQTGGTKATATLYTPNVQYELHTNIGHEGMTYVGVGGAIDGKINPQLNAKPGDVVQITLVNGDGAEHDVSFPDFNTTSSHVTGLGASTVIVFKVDKTGTFAYFCTMPGHRQAGMEGKLVVGGAAQNAPATPTAASVVRPPTEIPAPIGNRAATTVRVDLKTVEVVGQLADGATYTFWTFGGKVPGPFLRVRQGDTVELHLANDANSHMVHSIDLHAVTGPGGGAAIMQVPPGQEKSFTFQALNPGLYVYHCATAMVANHISNGMYGLILVEPPGGLPAVDHEFYVMQGEIYTKEAYGQHGALEFSVDKLLAEQPEFFTFNGAAKALTTDANALHAQVGQSVRIFFGVGGPNFTSSFHVIGEIFDRVYDQASLTSPPLTNVQTTLVPPGGATMVEFKLEVPGRYILVDHALSRMERGLMGFLFADGAANPTVFHEGPAK